MAMLPLPTHLVHNGLDPLRCVRYVALRRDGCDLRQDLTARVQHAQAEMIPSRRAQIRHAHLQNARGGWMLGVVVRVFERGDSWIGKPC